MKDTGKVGILTQQALSVALELQGTKEPSVIAAPWVLKHLLSALATHSSDANRKTKRMVKAEKAIEQRIVQYGV